VRGTRTFFDAGRTHFGRPVDTSVAASPVRRLVRRAARQFVRNFHFGLLALSVTLAGVGGTLVGNATTSSTGPIHLPTSHSHHRTASNRTEMPVTPPAALAATTVPPAPAPAAVALAPPLAPREDFAFAPYWTLPQSGTFTLTGLSTIAYFSIGVNPNGTLLESGPGWNGYESQSLATLITRAHAAGERVVLTVNDFAQASLDALTSSPTAPAILAAALIPALQAKNLDGVNFDFEGRGNGDQAGLTHLMAAVSAALRAADPHWQITMDTYASSAGDPNGFYDIPALAPSIDAFFVMAYELNGGAPAGPVSPLTSGMFSDVTTLAQYTAVVPADKVILGTGFFGIDWPTTDGTLQAQATGPATDIPDSQVQGSTDPIYWDPVTATGWTSYQVGAQWHESFFEDPLGLYDLSQLAAHYGVRGVGIWALGMEDDDTQMIAALDGDQPPGPVPSTGPVSTSASPGVGPTPVVVAPAGGNDAAVSTEGTAAPATPATPATPAPTTTTTTTVPSTTTAPTTTTTTSPWVTKGIFEGAAVTLTAVATVPVGAAPYLGTLTGFSTTNPAEACLAQDGPLKVYRSPSDSGDDVVVASAPTDCTSQEFTFPS
jgi:spore germination protein